MSTPPLSVAPMMDCTDRHYRAMMRLITRHTLLYTEMVHVGALLHGDRRRFLDFSESEHPVALQVGGDDPAMLAECARMGESWGYDEVNLNVGCPSSRVQKGNFGACLMAQPEVVARAVAAMRDAVSIPVTVKHRIGIDDLDRYEDMARFVAIVSREGAARFTVHARKAWLQGLSPRQNREVPPLRYDDVYRLKREFPHLAIEINGGFRDFETTQAQLDRVDAVMIGRAAYDDPWLFAAADRQFFGSEWQPESRVAVALGMLPYLEDQLAHGVPLHRMTRHMFALFAGQRGARAWRRHLTLHANQPGAGIEVVRQALALVAQGQTSTYGVSSSA